jgi:hypothetical protein
LLETFNLWAGLRCQEGKRSNETLQIPGSRAFGKKRHNQAEASWFCRILKGVLVTAHSASAGLEDAAPPGYLHLCASGVAALRHIEQADQ